MWNENSCILQSIACVVCVWALRIALATNWFFNRHKILLCFHSPFSVRLQFSFPFVLTWGFSFEATRQVFMFTESYTIVQSKGMTQFTWRQFVIGTNQFRLCCVLCASSVRFRVRVVGVRITIKVNRSIRCHFVIHSSANLRVWNVFIFHEPQKYLPKSGSRHVDARRDDDSKSLQFFFRVCAHRMQTNCRFPSSRSLMANQLLLFIDI